MLTKKIITAAQMRTYRAKNSSVMKGLLAKGADTLMRRKVTQKEFWNALRTDSKSHAVGDRGYTRKGLTKFLGGLLENKNDRLTDRKVKKLADIMDIKRSKVFRAAAEVRVEQNKAKIQERQIESQKKQQQQTEIRDHINEIRSRGHKKALENVTAFPSNAARNSDIKHGNDDFKADIATRFEISNSNIRNYEDSVAHSSAEHASENKSKAFGHLFGLKNMHHNYSGEEDEIEETKKRLALMQGKADNYDNDSENKIAA